MGAKRHTWLVVLAIVGLLMWLPVAIGSLTYSFGEPAKPLRAETQYMAIVQGAVSTVVLATIAVLILPKRVDRWWARVLAGVAVVLFVVASAWMLYLVAIYTPGAPA